MSPWQAPSEQVLNRPFREREGQELAEQQMDRDTEAEPDGGIDEQRAPPERPRGRGEDDGRRENETGPERDAEQQGHETKGDPSDRDAIGVLLFAPSALVFTEIPTKRPSGLTPWPMARTASMTAPIGGTGTCGRPFIWVRVGSWQST